MDFIKKTIRIWGDYHISEDPNLNTDNPNRPNIVRYIDLQIIISTLKDENGKKRQGMEVWQRKWLEELLIHIGGEKISEDKLRCTFEKLESILLEGMKL